MTTITRSVATAGILTVLAILLGVGLTSCDGTGSSPEQGDTTTSSATSSDPSESYDPTQPLTSAERDWLNAYDTVVENSFAQLEQGPENLDSRDEMLEEADRYRTCSQGLAKLPEPNARLRPAYDILTDACQHFDKAAICTETAADYVDGLSVPSSDGGLTLNEALDCITKEMPQASVTLGRAQITSLDIRTKAGNL